MILNVMHECKATDFSDEGITKEEAFEIMKNKSIDLVSEEMKKLLLIKFEESETPPSTFTEGTYSIRGSVCVLRPEQVEYINNMLGCLDLVGGERIRRTIMNEITNK